ncbi:MAG TPA: GAF domain-containing protein [Actinomycetota bacterium]|nr:GAF domain-containing protein [Actinomycetota bacterium]
MPSTETAATGALPVQPVTAADSYRRLADVLHHLLSEQTLDALLERIADNLADLVPHDALVIYTADEDKRRLDPVLARDPYAEQILDSPTEFGRGITGWAVEHREPVLSNQAHLDPRVRFIPGCPIEPEALIAVPLIARGSVKGVLNIYRAGADAMFTDSEFELARRFADAAALAIDNAEVRLALEHQAQTDPLTGLYNHRFFHERLRAELIRAGRSRDSVSVLMIDIDDFKKVNDVHGHEIGDQVLVELAQILKSTVRGSDVACRVGGEEFAVIMPSSDGGDAFGLATRIAGRVVATDFDLVGYLTISGGIAQGPEHAMNPRALAACSEAAMMTAKARGKDRIVLFHDEALERPGATSSSHDVRSIAHLKMLQSLTAKLNRLNDVGEIGSTIANELRTLIDYVSCLVWIREGDSLVPLAAKGELAKVIEEAPENLVRKVGEGIVGTAAATGRSLLIPNALECEYAQQVPGTPAVEESIVAVPLSYGSDVIGAIYISSLGVGEFDEDDVRLLEVLAGHASVALENARLYQSQRTEAQNAKALLEFADLVTRSGSFYRIAQDTVNETTRLLEAEQCSLWLEDERSDDFTCAAHAGYVGDPTAEPVIRARVTTDAAKRLLGDRRSPFVLDITEQDTYFDTPPEVVSRPLAIAPLRAGDGLSGWIVVRSPSGDVSHFVEERLRLLEGIAHQSSVALQKALLYKDQKESAEIASALLELSGRLSAAPDLDEVLTRTVELSSRLMGAPQASVWLEDPDTGDLVPEALWGYEGAAREHASAARYPKDVALQFLSARKPIVLPPGSLDQVDGIFDEARRVTWAVAPLATDGRLGCIAVAAPALGNYEFSERKMRLLEGIANQAELAINNAGNFDNLERTFVSTVEALANALEAKDEYTSDHARSITDMALEVGTEIRLDAQTMKNLELGALFHDIGKIGIPSDIIRKPGPLTDEERRVMEQHPELGEKILEPIERLTDVRPIVRACHERYDGAGYPDGKAREEIPIEARIIFCCDAFHAMTSDRPYRRRMPEEAALRQLEENAGTQFDPNVVRAFLDVMRRRSEVLV